MKWNDDCNEHEGILDDKKLILYKTNIIFSLSFLVTIPTKLLLFMQSGIVSKFVACFNLTSSAKQDGENADDHKVFDLVFYFINSSLKLNTLT